MRKIQTFVLRVLVDADEHPMLRGGLRCVASGREATFEDGPSLLSLLQQMSHGSGQASAASGERDPAPET